MIKILKKILVFIVLSLVMHSNVISQENILGVVQTVEGISLEFATVTVLEPIDSNIVSGQITNENGEFRLDVPQGKYLLAVNFVGYEQYLKEIEIKDGHDEFYTLIMETNGNLLKEVVVESKVPLVERKIDRFVFNVESSISSQGGTAWDVLSNSPGVRADFSGNISALGKGALVLVNGRETNLSGEDLLDYLQSMSSEDISKVEVIPNPSSQFDAEGGAIIDIIMKKNYKGGINGTIRTNFQQSEKSKWGIGTTLNYRSEKINMFLNYSYRNGKYLTEEESYIYYRDLEKNLQSDWNLDHVRIKDVESHLYKFGSDYFINSNQVIGFQFDGFNKSSDNQRDVFTTISNYKMSDTWDIDSTLESKNLVDDSKFLYALNANYSVNFDTLGSNLNLNLNYSTFHLENNQNLTTRGFDINGQEKLNPRNTKTLAFQDIPVLTAKIDYQYVMSGRSGFGVGAKFISITTKNDLTFWNKRNDIFEIDTNRTNEFDYTERTEALYFLYYSGIQNFTYQIGLRGEWTQTEAIQKTIDQTNKRNYFKLFPSVLAQLRVGENQVYNFSYGKRIQRPEYWRLNPFQYYTTPYSYLVGNPFLQPSFTNSFELSMSYNQYTFALYYNQSNGKFTNISEQDNETQLFVDNQINLDKTSSYGAYVLIPINITDWWDTNNFIQVSQQRVVSNYLEGEFNRHTLFAYLSSANTFILSKDKSFRGELNAWYTTDGLQGIYRLGSRFDVGLGLKKTFKDDKLILSLNVNDIFYSTYYDIGVDYLDQKNGFIEKNDTRSVIIGLSYRFGSDKILRPRQRDTGNEEEKSRIGG